MPSKRKNKKIIEEVSQNAEDARRALLNILEDVEEERKRAEEEKNKTLAVITSLVDGLLVFDRENKLSLFNLQAERLFDVKNRDVIGRSFEDLKTFPTLASLVDLIGKNPEGVSRGELTAAGSVLEVSTVPIFKDKEKIGWLVILHDITREKRIESMKTEFVSLAAHQLRTPLAAIKWSLKMMLEGDLGELNKEQREFIDKTYQSNERMIVLINDLLDITRIEEGKYLFKTSLTSIEPIVQFVASSYKDELARRNLKMEINRPNRSLPKVLIDVEKMRLAIQNLIDNAVRYTSPGGSITISLLADKKNVEFKIKDTGVGIREDQKARIFTKFFRSVNVVRMETEGSGLGLFITKNIIEAHGGKIWFESQEGKGTTFYFTLPAKEEFAQFLEKF